MNVKIISCNIIYYYIEEKNAYNTFIDFFKKVVWMLQKTDAFVCKKIAVIWKLKLILNDYHIDSKELL